MCSCLRLHLREVGVQVEHSWICVPQEADACGPQAVNGVGRVQPLAQHVPGRVVADERACHGLVWDARTRERACDLRDAARRTIGEPFAGSHAFVIERACRLKIEDDDGRIDGLHDRKHLRRCRVRRRVEHDEVEAFSGQCRAGLSCSLGAVDQPGRHDFCTHFLESCFDLLLVALEPLTQAVELRPVRGKADSEHADARRRAEPPRFAAVRVRAGRARRCSGR